MSHMQLPLRQQRGPTSQPLNRGVQPTRVSPTCLILLLLPPLRPPPAPDRTDDFCLQRSIIAHSCCSKSDHPRTIRPESQMNSSFWPHAAPSFAMVKYWGWWWWQLLAISLAVCVIKGRRGLLFFVLFMCLKGLLKAGWIVCPQVTVWIAWLIVFQLLIN